MRSRKHFGNVKAILVLPLNARAHCTTRMQTMKSTKDLSSKYRIVRNLINHFVCVCVSEIVACVWLSISGRINPTQRYTVIYPFYIHYLYKVF